MFSGARLVVIAVPEGLEVYSTAKGQAYHRVNTDCVPMRPLDITRLADERRGVDWSAKASGRQVSEIDPLALHYCRRLFADSGDSTRKAYGKLKDTDLLVALRAVAEDGSLSRAGELLLCQAATSGPAEVVVYQHRRTPAGEPDSILRWGTPLIIAIEELFQAMRIRQDITPLTLPNGQQWQIEDYPSVATREAIVNAFVHGDWRMGLPIQLEHSPQCLRVTSPGPLVAGVTPSNILTRGSRARHPALAAAFRLVGLVEEVGQGVDRMYREMIRSGRDVPVITEDAEQVTVLFRGQPPNKRIAKFLAGLPESERDDTDAMLIIHMLCAKRTVTAALMAPVIQRSELEAQASLLRLASDPLNIVEPTRSTVRHHFPTYRLKAEVVGCLGTAVAYHRLAVDDIDKKIIEHLLDYGEVNNRTIRRLFDVDVYQARDILRRLVEKKVIERVSSQARGSAVRYAPGPAFPKGKRAPAR